MMNRSFPRLVVALFLLSGWTLSAWVAAQAQESPPDPYAALANWEFGQSRQPLAQIDDQIRQAAPAEYKRIEARLLEVLESAETPEDAQRYICRTLAVVGSAECVHAVAKRLDDENLSHPARMALEALPHPAAAAALRDALSTLKGERLLGVISSVAARRDAEAVPALGDLAGNGNTSIAGSALTALGQIGTEEAVRAWQAMQPPPALAQTHARAGIAAAHRLALAGKRQAAAGICQSLLQPQHSAAIRVAALKGLLETLPAAEAVQRFVDVIQADDDALRTAALAAYGSSPAGELKDAVAEALPSLKPASQLLLLGLLAGDADVAARSAVLQVLETAAEVEVRVAAVACLALHGQARDVPRIVQLAQAEPAAVAEAARRVLPQMSQPGVNETLVGMIEAGQPGDRAVVLAALAARRVESALPTLARLVGGSDAELAIEAARALSVLGARDQLQPLAAVLSGTGKAELRSAAAEAVRAICSRSEDKSAAAQPLLAALAQAATPEARIALLQLLVYTRGDEALHAVRQATHDGDARVAEAAIRALIAWPEASAAPRLIELAKTTDKASFAVLALRDGCLRLANQKDLPLAQRVEIYRQVLEVAKRPEEKRQAIAGLADLPALEALELLQATARDAEGNPDATAAILRLARQLGAVYHRQSLAALDEVKTRAASDEVKRQAEAAIRAVQNVGQSPEGFVVAWLLSGPYTASGKSGTELFDIAFAPETSDGSAEWRPLTAPREGNSGLVELDKIFGGNDRAAYLKTQLAADNPLDAVLELGSDDGIKVWLNGQIVHANNAARPCSPGQDKVRVKLQQGVNTLLIKVTQDGGGWAACCRIATPDGNPLDGVTVALQAP